MIPQRPVFCIRCSHEFLSKSEHPRCSACRSFKVVDHRTISAKKDIVKMRVEVDNIKVKISKINLALEYTIGKLEDLINELKKDGVIYGK